MRNFTGLLVNPTKQRESTYNAWYSMMDRCHNSRNTSFKDYGGRGITVCEEWKKFDKFFEDMGDRPDGLQLDRIKNDEGYCAANCRWATPMQNGSNKRNNVRFTLGDETLTISEWSRKLGRPISTIYSRYVRGWSIERILT